MGAIGGMLGLNGGTSGTGVAGPASANLMSLVQPDQAQYAYSNMQNMMSGQQKIFSDLGDQQAFGKQSDVYGQLQGIASGQGPNPAQQQFRNNANQIGAQTAGLIGSQKGMSPALQARLIAQQGAGAQQAMAGQNAQALAQQQLGALGMAGNLANTMVGNYLNQGNVNAQTALGFQGNILGAGGQQNNALNANQANINSNNTALAQGIMGNQAAFIGGGMNAAGAAIGKPTAAAHGGMIEGGPASSFGKHISMQKGGKVPGHAAVAGDSEKNDTVVARLSPGEIVIPRTVVNSSNPSEAAKRFVEAVLAKKGKK